MQHLRPGVRATIVPGKTYEYLASGTPILAAVPEGDARDILQEAGNATLTAPDDVDAIAEAILAALERFRAGLPLQRPAAEVVDRFEYRKLAGELAGVFDTVLDAQRRAAPQRGTGPLERCEACSARRLEPLVARIETRYERQVEDDPLDRLPAGPGGLPLCPVRHLLLCDLGVVRPAGVMHSQIGEDATRSRASRCP